MVSVAALFLMILGFAVVAYPLMRPAARLVTGARHDDDDVDEMTRERDAAYGAIKELEFEYQLGNLSPEDFQGLRDQYAERAARALSRLDAAEERARAEEAERAEAAAAAVSQVATLPPGTCPLCGQPVAEGDRFCSECGALLSRFCPVCGGQREPADTNCARCGSALKAEA